MHWLTVRLLILGGTAWLGRTVAAEAVDAGHHVDCLARGRSGKTAPGAGFFEADRDRENAYASLGAERWDAVVDVARQPGHVRRAVEFLADRADHYVFVSTGNVYADHRTIGTDEAAPLLAPLDGEEMTDMAQYGAAKVSCETHVAAGFGDSRAAIVRAGLIGGPGDVSGRSGYWPWRFARPSAGDGRVLVPDALDQPTQVVDVRDLASWLVHVATQRISGVFNATGPTTPLGDNLQTAREIAGNRGNAVLADPQWLTRNGVQAWMGPKSFPLWLNDPDWTGFVTRDSGRARAAGLTNRPLGETLADTLQWELQRPDAPSRGAGLTDDEERALLKLLDAA